MPDFKPFAHFFFYYQSLHRCDYLGKCDSSQPGSAGQAFSILRALFRFLHLAWEKSSQISSYWVHSTALQAAPLLQMLAVEALWLLPSGGYQCSVVSLVFVALLGLRESCSHTVPLDITHLCNLGFLWSLTLLPNASLSSPYIEPASNKAHL